MEELTNEEWRQMWEEMLDDDRDPTELVFDPDFGE